MGVRMRLKRLTLQGFKTFADRTEIEFVPGVTCIVGPNGSGKSNLLDALVWCLGDTKASSVRATRAQDVIFAGSAKRKPMGMAEVSLTVDNEDRFLPLDFNEVTITRRVYRSGEGEYFINKASCRLRDITELFLDTGVGKGAYAIVNQSEIDAILSARPEDRRELFEEAAGIKKYRVRKREAQRKLENTETNLIRVRDILSELDGQVEPLRRQSELALRHRELSEQLRHVEVGQLAADHRRLRDEITELSEAAAGAFAEAEAADRETVELEEGADQLGMRIAAAEEKLEGARLRQQSAMTESERLEGRIALSEQRVASARQTLESLEQDVASALSEADRCEADAGVATDGVLADQALGAKLDTQLGDGASRLRGIETALAEVQAAMAGREADLQKLARTLERHRLEQATLRERISRRRSDIEDVEQRQARRSEECASSRRDLELLAQDRETAAQAHVKAVAAVKETAEPELARCIEGVQASIDDRSAAERELASVESRLAALEETEAAKEGYFAGVRAVLSAVADGQVSGRFRLFADAIRVPAQLETAIEVALGASLQDVITDTQRGAKEAIEWLNRNRAGRATFLPLDALRDQPVPDSLRMASRKHAGALGSAADLVECDAVDDPAVRVHLARVLVVEDLDCATRIAGSSDRDWARIVTLGGELVVPTGAITGGRTGRSGPNLLGRKREIAELGKQAERCRRRIDEGTTRIDDLRGREAACRVALRDADAAVLAARDQERDAERKGQAKQLELQRLEADLRQLETRRESLSREAEVDRGREQELEAALAVSGEDDQGVQSSLDDAARRRAALETERDKEREALAVLRSEWASLRERLAGKERELARLNAEASRHRARVVDLNRRAELSRGLLSTEADVGANWDSQRQACASAIREATLDLERCRERRQAMVAENFQLAERIRLLRRASEAARERGRQGQVRSARLESQAEAIAQRLLEEYELHPDSAWALTSGQPPTRDTTAEVARLRREIKALGPVNPGAIEEYERVSERHRFLAEQRSDLEESRRRLLEAIQEIDESTRGVFADTFAAVGQRFDVYFQRLFGGGSTELVLTDPEDILETGIDIVAQPPGKRRQNLALLSGGERALTATALLFAFLDVRPAPFCVLDEVDAPLDGANVEKFADLVREFGQGSQFILITHNATTMEAAPLWYGVTMQEPGISRGISMRVPDSSP